MSEIILLNSTQNEQVDALLYQCISLFETAFPGRIRGYYVEGSYANSYGVSSSDVDFVLVFKGHFVQGEQQRAEEIATYCATKTTIELDVEIVDEEKLLAGVWPTLKLASLLLYGEDIRPHFSLVSLAEWTRDRMHSSYWRTVKLFHRPLPLRYPLDYPDPMSEFYGYDLRKLRLSDGQEVPCTRDLIRLVGWSATALIACKAGKYVARKSECHILYKECFHDEWGQLLQDIYEYCRGQWNYIIPIDAQERRLLRSICERTLGFENHFLSLYKNFALAELRSPNGEAIRHALWVLREMPFQDAEIQGVIESNNTKM